MTAERHKVADQHKREAEHDLKKLEQKLNEKDLDLKILEQKMKYSRCHSERRFRNGSSCWRWDGG